jgi:type IV secretion system protein TrbI
MTDFQEVSGSNAVQAEMPHPVKADPETVALREKPAGAVKFKKSVIIGGSALTSAALVAVAWMSLSPATFHLVAEGNKPVATDRKGVPDALAGAPKTYGDIPKLGPPLPGDLGKPILERQRELAMVSEGEPTASSAASAKQEAEAERQRQIAEQESVRAASVMVQRTGGIAQIADTPPQPATNDIEASVARNTITPGDSDPNGQQRKLSFLNNPDARANINPYSLTPAPSPWTLAAGTVISASLITGLNSDLPGFVTAQVTENARDSVTGKTILIPQGSRLIGKYDSVIAFGQRRALVVWQRIILPDGSSINIDNMPATDTAGYAGLADKVDVHSWQLLKGIGLSTLLGVGTQIRFGSSESDLVRAVRESAQQNADRVGQQITAKALDIQPSVTVRPGWPLRVVVHKDIIMKPWQGGQ